MTLAMKTSLQAFAASLTGAVLLSVASPSQAQSSFTLKSTDIAAGGVIAQSFAFNGFGCTGQNESPSLMWANPPEGTKSFALMVHDPDAPTGGAGFWHWVVIDVPANVSALARGTGTSDGTKLPQAARQVATDFGMPGWGGPCPPAGDSPHRYIFTLYALKVDKLSVPEHATASLTGFLVNANAIAKAQFAATYGR